MPESYEPLDGRRQAVEVVFVALVAIAIVACVFDILEVQLMDRIVTGDTITEAEATANDTELGGLLVASWTAFILSGWAANIALRGLFDDQTPQDLRDSSIALAISDGIDIFGAIVAILVVRAATDRLDGRAAELGTPEPEPFDGGEEAPEQPAGLPV
jgi:hypothetical protein